MISKTLGVIGLITLFFSCTTKSEVLVLPSDSNLLYQGRVDTFGIETAKFYWSGSSVEISFEADSIGIQLEDQYNTNYYNVLVDNDSAILLRPDTSKKTVVLTGLLSPGKHHVKVFKRTEYDKGSSEFHGFVLYGDAKVHPIEPKKRTIEFYGNSITAGYAVEDYSGNDNPDSTYTNNYLSYARLTANHFDANYRCICKSGIGITISWFPGVMPDIYDRINPYDSSRIWDFSLVQPEVVVVNLLQNDAWLVLMPEREEFKTNFGDKAPTDKELMEAYKNFISKIRGHYPNANIVCMLGNMDISGEWSKYPELVKNAVLELNDDKIFSHVVPFKDTPGHPRIEEQAIMANSLIQFIEDTIEW